VKKKKKKKTLVNFLTDPLDRRSTLTPTDVMVYGRVVRKHTCMDLSRVSPLIGLWVKTFTVGHTVLKVESSKVAEL